MNFSTLIAKSKWTVFPITILTIFLLSGSVAFLQEIHDIDIEVNGKKNNFHLEFAGSVDPSWDPTTGPWFAGGSNATISPYETFPDIPIGQSVTAKLAVRNTSTILPGALIVSITDPNSNGSTNSLFEQLLIQIQQNGHTISQGAATNMVNIPIGKIAAGEILVFDFTLSFPQSLASSYENLRTDVQMQIRGESQ